MSEKFIRCENGDFILVRNVTKLSLQEDAIAGKTDIVAHHNGPSMPFTVASFDARKDAFAWLIDLIDRIEHGQNRSPLAPPKPGRNRTTTTTDNFTGPYEAR